ncbi:unnamed protein product [Toxocara canis]|uniref:ZP domain-containing protein n=1 Tax=Toxocara canis TaxID=6265 RepID=A0A183UEN5_TOXCA|nr:unnamed protein product [Toxocara canis]
MWRWVLKLCHRTATISIDNDIIGDPDIECLEDQIRVFVKTRKIFAGRIYAKGKADNPDCSKDDFAKERTKKPHMDLKFGMCGMKSLRSVDPRGMYYGITLMFITKVDQAFHVKCFFEEASRGLTAELGVSMIPTTEVEARHSIPGCSYSIHSSSIDELDAGKPAGPPIQFARVGDRVLHQWHCDDGNHLVQTFNVSFVARQISRRTPKRKQFHNPRPSPYRHTDFSKMFGILINNCYVTDGFGKRADVVDSKGCSVDAILITGIRYSPDLQRAYAESQVFKFADRPGVWFFCQIQMCMKKAGMCNGVTPPSCASSATGATEEEAMSVNEDFEAEMKSNVLGKGSDKATMNLPKHNGHMKLPFGQQEGPRRTTEPFQYTGSASYGITETAEDFDVMKEHVTVFGPGFPLPNALEKDGIHYGPAHKAILGNAIPTTERPQNSMAVVTTVFEADEAYAATSGRVNAKGAYADYDEEEVTIPANLNDLLANLPDDFSADSLQKMFRDSVEDRRALLQGFDMLMNQARFLFRIQLNRHLRAKTNSSKQRRHKPKRYSENQTQGNSTQKISSMQDSWRSRMADAPLGKVEDDERFANRHHVNAVEEPPFDPDAPPMIAGRLLIYDLDEEPPNTAIKTNRDEQQSSPKSCAPSGCAISRHGLFVLASGLGTFCAVLLVVTVFMYARLSRTLMFPRELAYESSASPPSKPVNNELSGGSIASGIQRNRLRAPDWNLEN